MFRVMLLVWVELSAVVLLASLRWLLLCGCGLVVGFGDCLL